MTDINLTEFHTYKKENSDDAISDEEIKLLSDYKSNLPVHKEYSTISLTLNQDGEKVIHTGHLIGVFWLNKNESTLKIKPRKINDKYVDFYAMLDVVLNHPVVNKHLDDCYKIFDNEPKIKVEKEFSDLANIFLLIHFLRLVNTISKQGLKKGYRSKTENLNAKIKGKILVKDTVRNNHFKGRMDKTYCQYQEYSINCLENQILASTLDKISSFICSTGIQKYIDLLNQNKAAFRQVERVNLNPFIFKQVKTSHFFQNYKRAINLARQIYHNHIPSLSSEKLEFSIFPFYINMPELFERYCEVKLREQYNDILAGYGYNTRDSQTETKVWKLRPDFLIPSLNMILDSKYKPWYKDKTPKENYESDFKQLALYARHKEILEKIYGKTNKITNKVPKLVFIYPGIKKNKNDKLETINTSQNAFKMELNEKDSEEGFTNIFKVLIAIPLVES